MKRPRAADGGLCFVPFVPPAPHCRVLCRYYLFVHVRRGWRRGAQKVPCDPGLRPHPPGAGRNTAAPTTFFCEPQQSGKKMIPSGKKIRSRFTEFKVKLPSRFSLVSRQREGDWCYYRPIYLAIDTPLRALLIGRSGSVFDWG